MKKLFLILVFILTSVSLLGQNYKHVKIFLGSDGTLSDLIKIGVEIDHASFEKDNSIIVYISDEEFEIVQSSPFRYEVLINDWNSYYENLPQLSSEEKNTIIQNSIDEYDVEGLTFGSMGGYYIFDEIVAQLDLMYANFPNIITQKFSIGTTIEGRTIWAVRISDNPNINENEPQILLDALMHAREAASMSTLMYYMFYLLENYGTNEEVTYLVDNREIFFVPCVNPDGYEYNRSTNPNGGGMWRKNRRNNGGGVYGVDLNRNFGYKWGYDNIGSSPTPSSITYRGPSPFSEPETQSLRSFFNARNIKTYINFHCYSDVIIHPWGYEDLNTPDSALFNEYSADMSFWNGYPYGTANATIGYEANGGSIDWTYGEQLEKNKVISYTFEIGTSSDGFWAPQNRIFPLAQLNLRPNLYNTWVAGEYVSVIGADYNLDYFNPGDFVELNPKCRNKGLSTGYNLSIDMNSPSPSVSIQSGSILIDSLQALTAITAAEVFSFNILPSASIGEEVQLVFDVKTNGVLITSDTLKIVIGTPVVLFQDDENSPSVNWALSGTPANMQWGATASSFYSAPNSYSESPNGNYTNNSEVRMVSLNPIDLSGAAMPSLTFWTKYDIENNWDCGQVMISTNGGAAWTPLAGNYTVAGSGSGAQPLNEPVYEGKKLSWVYEQIDLSAYEGHQVHLKFEFRTDGSIVYDGWYIDEIKIFYYGIVPVELTHFSVVRAGSSALLNWTTATELNNLGFEIQKSTDKIEWKTAAFLEGSGTTSKPKNYSFLDSAPHIGKSYYQIVQQDFDGTRNEVALQEFTFAPEFRYSLEQNYPNPFNPSTIIRYSLKETGHVKIKLFSITGEQLLLIVNEVKNAGNYKVELNLNDALGSLSSGIYFYSIESGTFRSTNKMVILK